MRYNLQNKLKVKKVTPITSGITKSEAPSVFAVISAFSVSLMLALLIVVLINGVILG